MAATPEGRRLTDAHRIAQVQLSTKGIAAVRLLWPQLNPADLAGTRDEWLNLTTNMVKGYDQRSASLAAAYLERFRQIEDEPGPIVGLVDGFDEKWARSSLGSNGPGLIAARLDAGADLASAEKAALSATLGQVKKLVLAGGRRVVDQSSLANPRSVGWRRVSDGSPCSFCAMLVSRGPAYRSESTARGGRRYHRACGCTVEEVFGEWQPTTTEQRFVDAYEAAAESANRDGLPRTEASVLPRMREAGSFNDSPGQRPKPAPEVDRAQLSLPTPRKARDVPTNVLDRNARELRQSTDAELEGALSKAYESDHPNADAIAAEIDRRDQAPLLAEQRKAVRAEAAKAKRDAAKEAQWTEVQRRIDAGVDPREAIADVTGLSVERQLRAELTQRLRQEGVPGGSLDQMIRAKYDEKIAELYIDAEDFTRGHMLTKLGESRGLDPFALFKGPEARARKWASPELKEWWDQQGRLTLEAYTEQLLTGTTKYRRVDDFLQ